MRRLQHDSAIRDIYILHAVLCSNVKQLLSRAGCQKVQQLCSDSSPGFAVCTAKHSRLLGCLQCRLLFTVGQMYSRPLPLFIFRSSVPFLFLRFSFFFPCSFVLYLLFYLPPALPIFSSFLNFPLLTPFFFLYLSSFPSVFIVCVFLSMFLPPSRLSSYISLLPSSLCHVLSSFPFVSAFKPTI